MNNPFWNSRQRRVRALWRFVAQALLLCVVTLLLLVPSALILFFDALPGLVGYLVLAFGALVGILFSVWLPGRLLDRRAFADFGFHLNRRWWLDFAFGLALGMVLVAGIFLVERNAGWTKITEIVLAPWNPVAHSLVIGGTILLGSLINGLLVQLVWRGYYTRNLAEGLNLPHVGPGIALLISYLVISFVTFLFQPEILVNALMDTLGYLTGVLHLFEEQSALVLRLLIISLFLGLGYLLTGELAIPIGVHTGWSFSRNLFFGRAEGVFGIRGLGGHSMTQTFIETRRVGPELWTGGRAGLDAGLLTLVAAVVGSLLIVLWVRWRYGRVQLQDSLAQYERATPASSHPPVGRQRGTSGTR